jgi:hypothetical protein
VQVSPGLDFRQAAELAPLSVAWIGRGKGDHLCLDYGLVTYTIGQIVSYNKK